MGQHITIRAGDVSAEAELNDSPCAGRIFDALPIEATVNTWGQEIYFDIGVSCELGPDARDDVAVGELGYWPTGRAFCVFFGATPASGPDGAPRAASAVNIIGRMVGDAGTFASVRDGESVVLEARA